MTERKKNYTVKTELDDFGRKKFTLDEGQSVSGEEEVEEKGPVQVGRHKSMLVGREEGLGIQKYIGRIDKNKKKAAKEIFYCEVCSEGFKCDLAYLTHVNSPQHNRKLGMSMKVKAVSVEEVAQKLKRLRDPSAAAKPNPPPLKRQENDQEEESLVKQQEQKNQVKKQQQKGQQERSQQEEDMEAVLKSLGLPTSFGSKKQKR